MSVDQEEQNSVSAKVGKCATRIRKEGKIRMCRCLMSLDMDSIGTADDACVGVGLVGDGGRTTRSRVSE